MPLFSYRQIAAFGFLTCATSMLIAIFYFQKHLGLEPCPMCIFQRVAVMASGLIFLLAALHNPKGNSRWGYAVLALITSCIGAAIAARHTWLQNLPEDQRPACGPTLDYLIERMPLRNVVSTVLKGDGNCAKIDWTLLGYSIPAWTFIVFALLAVLALAMPIFGKKTRVTH